jgi:hypothetical protein
MIELQPLEASNKIGSIPESGQTDGHGKAWNLEEVN